MALLMDPGTDMADFWGQFPPLQTQSVGAPIQGNDATPQLPFVRSSPALPGAQTPRQGAEAEAYLQWIKSRPQSQLQWGSPEYVQQWNDRFGPGGSLEKELNAQFGSGNTGTAQPPSGSAQVPQFTAGMTPDQVRQAVTQFFAAKGVQPFPTSVDSWVNYYNQWGSKDPAYFTQRLGQADEFTGAGQAGNFSTPGFGALGQLYTGQYSLPSQSDLENMPGYQAGLNAYRQGIERSAASRGTLLTGGTLQWLGQAGADYAAQNYGNLANLGLGAFNTNYGVSRNERNDLFNRNLSLAQLGKPE